MFLKSRSKRHESLVECVDDREHGISSDSIQKSVDFSTTTESTDSGELFSFPTTPSDVFLEYAQSPVNLNHPVTNIEDLYFPHRDSNPGGLTDSRKRMTERLMGDLDNDDNYIVSPTNSRQTTVEKALSYIDDKELRIDTKLDAVSQNKSESICHNDKDEYVKCIMSENDNSFNQFNKRLRTTPGISFLSIVNSAVDRLSDSGSDHTLVDHQSTTSSESPRPQCVSEFEDMSTCCSEKIQNGQFAGVEDSPVVYSQEDNLSLFHLDENDNLAGIRPCQVCKKYYYFVFFIF